MFAVTWRFVAGLAIGGAAALLWSSRRAASNHAAEPATDRQRRINDKALDEAVEETFPASDPPAFTQQVITGPPRRARRADGEEEIAEAHPS